MADLVEWSYHNPESQDETLESQVSEALLNVHEMPLDLQLPCIESGVLTLLATCSLAEAALYGLQASGEESRQARREADDHSGKAEASGKALSGHEASSDTDVPTAGSAASGAESF